MLSKIRNVVIAYIFFIVIIFFNLSYFSESTNPSVFGHFKVILEDESLASIIEYSISGANLFFATGLIELLIFAISCFFFYRYQINKGIISVIIGIFIHTGNYIYAFFNAINFNPDPNRYIFIGLRLKPQFLIIFIPYLVLFSMITYLAITKYRENNRNISQIKKTILYLSTKYPELEIREIAEKSGEYPDLIIEIVKKMIEDNEIYAEYFGKSKMVAFDKQANINEINSLMEIYNQWETNEIGKKTK
ncbi:MAG: hypothetical protein EU547_04305 [Promethearchaeota archaeon]|nr:MAG: hypothetical protein EU547_04305 [Candidatus Lokiarchaeota archaeon]